jgi:hypothetical protein
VAPSLPEKRRAARRLLKRLAAVLILASAVISFSFLRGPVRAGSRTPPIRRPSPVSASPGTRNAPAVWPVERNAQSETYSNGLRIDTRFAVPTHARSYLAFSARRGAAIEPRNQPVGIVFHATESQQATFEARENRALNRIAESLLEYVRRRRSYNFVIDRFGRVYRVVTEDQVANHAGHSVWADENWTYLNLNESFLGISFEAEWRHPDLSPAQVRSAIMLLEMLRSRYPIPAANCVTHAQVSVNPFNMRVGYHVDWAAGFPFATLGLPDNYAEALPALWRFGFESDQRFQSSAGSSLKAGIENAEYRLDEDAHRVGMTPASYRKALRTNYRQLLAEMHRTGTGENSEPE